MTTVTINNSQQCQVEQQMIVNQLMNNGLLSAGKKLIGAGAGAVKAGFQVGKANPASASKYLGKKGGSKLIKAGAAAGIGAKKIGTQAKAMGIQAKRAGLRAGNFVAKNPGATAVGSAGAGMIAGSQMSRRKK